MGFVDPFKNTSSALMTCSDHFKFKPNSVNRYCTKIMLCLLLADSSTCHFQVTTLVALSAGKVKST